MAQLDQNQDELARTRDLLNKMMEMATTAFVQVDKVQKETVQLLSNKRTRTTNLNNHVLYGKLDQELKHQQQHQKEQQPILRKKPAQQKQQPIDISDIDEEEEKKPQQREDKWKAPNTVDELEEEVSNLTSNFQKESDQNDEQDSSIMSLQSNKLETKKKKELPKTNKKDLNKMIQSSAVRNQLKKLKKIQVHPNDRDEDADNELEQIKAEFAAYRSQQIEKDNEYAAFRSEQIQKDNAFYGTTVTLMHFLNNLSASSPSSIAANKKSIQKVSDAIERFPIPVESRKCITLAQLQEWKKDVQVAATNEFEAEEEENKNKLSTIPVSKSTKSSRTSKKESKVAAEKKKKKPWDSNLPPRLPAKNLNVNKKKPKISTLTSPTAGGGSTFGSE